MPVCVFVGLDRAGKSSIKVYLETLNTELAEKTKMSNGIEVYQRGKLKIEVFPGQRRLRYNEKLYEVYFRIAKKIVFIVDSADHTRFDEVRKYWDYVLNMIKKYCENVEIIFVAHKQDLKEAIRAEELFRKLSLQSDNIPVRYVNTTIYDPWSIARLLKIIHGADRAGVDDITDTLRKLCDADLAFIYDGHILPIAFSPKIEGDIIVHINDVLCSLEKIDRIRAFVGYFTEKNLVLVSVGVEKERILVGVYGFRKPLREILQYCKEAGERYVRTYRSRLWGW